MNASLIEIALARKFNYRMNIIVPNVHWGLNLSCEIDLLIITPHRYATEIEIKVSTGDIKADLKKNQLYAHKASFIKKFFFAVPEKLNTCKYLPEDCGLISVNNDLKCRIIKPPRINKNARKLTEGEIGKVLHLGCMRIWNLKAKIIALQNARKKR